MTGPINNPAPPGPGRIPGTPLSLAQRADNYRRQTGSPVPTARQQRRLTHKANRALSR